jgi:hypothetical protein
MKIATMILTAMLFAAGPTHTVNFDKAEAGKTPAGWTATQTGSGQAKWAVAADDTAPSKPNVLRQSGQATYPVCIKDDTSLKDGFVEVKFRPISGREDQAGGLIWRAKDANNEGNPRQLAGRGTAQFERAGCVRAGGPKLVYHRPPWRACLFGSAKAPRNRGPYGDRGPTEGRPAFGHRRGHAPDVARHLSGNPRGALADPVALQSVVRDHAN